MQSGVRVRVTGKHVVHFRRSHGENTSPGGGVSDSGAIGGVLHHFRRLSHLFSGGINLRHDGRLFHWTMYLVSATVFVCIGVGGTYEFIVYLLEC